ncbi:MULTISPECIES: methyltransferase domain-containing protein [unclassified Streptomyces]|uniref:methyltransferase domain-containing protein n=1 Tax=unclassified Streptomyces TaxID=2593676 RepID=UPI000F6C7AA0|nr:MULTISPECIES: methyltransferase domain-containing protein [unclassified Streptomyces]AZM64198.1 SAM-dependent methyltransferase [Streptomyces sp. WAC 01438]RSM93492.1 SAM-dependent methyltransferase [Streptomyces sp. WAC 01420]
MATYDTLGTTYARTRLPDPRIAAQIRGALGDAADVINVGAGAGSYEPPGTVLAVEPSRVMIAKRPQGAAPAVQAVAERLPLPSAAADAVMALLTIHHWSDLAAGLRELRRVARRRIVVLTWDQHVFRERFWLVRDYLPEAAAFDDTRAVPVDRLLGLLGGGRQEPVRIPHDCVDGFAAAYWRRPHCYLDPQVRAGISMLAQTGDTALAPGLARLDADLASGRWHSRYAGLRTCDTIDVGYRLVVSEL